MLHWCGDRTERRRSEISPEVRKCKAYVEQERSHHANKRRFLGRKREHLQAEVSALQKEVRSQLWQDTQVRLASRDTAALISSGLRLALACRMSVSPSFCQKQKSWQSLRLLR